MPSNEDLVFIARIAEQAERYEEMVENMKIVVKSGHDLSVEERNLLSVAYRNVISARRASLRVVSFLEEKDKHKGSQGHLKLIQDYRAKIESELTSICREILEIIATSLIPTAKDAESKVFYYKLKGDYLRYLAEFLYGEERKTIADESLGSYESAVEIATDQFDPTHHARLGLALNFSVFYYEILNFS